MPFEDRKRVIYNKNQLVKVTCQLRFPRILSINDNDPSKFQERLRDKYPLYNKFITQQQQLAFVHTPDAQIQTPKILQSESLNNYSFSSDDMSWSINLTSTSFSLTTSEYVSWYDFKNRLQEPFNALLDIYKPAFFERVILRYINAFRRSQLGLDSTPWNKLIKPMALGFLSNDTIKDDVIGYATTSEIKISEKTIARINSLLGKVKTDTSEASELAFIIDNEMFFTERKNVGEAIDALDELHSFSWKLIGAVIEEELHQAMEPKDE